MEKALSPSSVILSLSKDQFGRLWKTIGAADRRLGTEIVTRISDIFTRSTRLTRLTRLIFFAVLTVGYAMTVARVDAAALSPNPPVELTGTHGKFDFIKVDAAHRRLLACHTGNGSFDVIVSIPQNSSRASPTGAAQGVAIDGRRHR